MTMTTVDLRVEAAVEARRLANARALLRDGDERLGFPGVRDFVSQSTDHSDAFLQGFAGDRCGHT